MVELNSGIGKCYLIVPQIVVRKRINYHDSNLHKFGV